MSYLVLAYPELTNEDLLLIEEYRKKYDHLYYNIVKPHFTIVFAIQDPLKVEVVQELKIMSASHQAIPFVLNKATVHEDIFTGHFHVFAETKEGANAIARLHDSLYGGLLAPYLRHDIPYIPHITIGNSKDRATCERAAMQWNAAGHKIKGSIVKLSLTDYTAGQVTTLEEWELGTT